MSFIEKFALHLRWMIPGVSLFFLMSQILSLFDPFIVVKIILVSGYYYFLFWDLVIERFSEWIYYFFIPNESDGAALSVFFAFSVTIALSSLLSNAEKENAQDSLLNLVENNHPKVMRTVSVLFGLFIFAISGIWDVIGRLSAHVFASIINFHGIFGITSLSDFLTIITFFMLIYIYLNSAKSMFILFLWFTFISIFAMFGVIIEFFIFKMLELDIFSDSITFINEHYDKIKTEQ